LYLRQKKIRERSKRDDTVISRASK